MNYSEDAIARLKNCGCPDCMDILKLIEEHADPESLPLILAIELEDYVD